MIKIVTDSTASTTKEFALKHDISIVPLDLILDGVSFEEKFPGENDEFFNKMETAANHPHSSQPSPDRFKSAFEKILANGDEIICFTLSQVLSGTFNSARLAAEMCDTDKISVFDTNGCGQVSLLYIEKAVELISQGKSRSEIIEYLTEMTEVTSQVFVPVSLKHLIKGGRIGGVSAVIGSLLHVKPMLVFTKGVLVCSKKVIGMQKAIREIVAEIPKTARKIYVIHIYKSAFLEPLFQLVKDAFPNLNILKGEMSPVIGAHVGPGAVGVAYTSKD